MYNTQILTPQEIIQVSLRHVVILETIVIVVKYKHQSQCEDYLQVGI